MRSDILTKSSNLPVRILPGGHLESDQDHPLLASLVKGDQWQLSNYRQNRNQTVRCSREFLRDSKAKRLRCN